MITIQSSTPLQIPIIQQIALATWRPTYSRILGDEQLDYMFEMMYSTTALSKQYENCIFLIAFEQEIPVGFACFEFLENETKLHKLYLLPSTQGKGIGKLLIEEVSKNSLAQNLHKISLNVNRYNKAFGFYEKLGFVMAKEEDIDIGNGYFMNDFVMELNL